MIPSVFAGASAVYREIGAEISNQTATAHKTEIWTAYKNPDFRYGTAIHVISRYQF